MKASVFFPTLFVCASALGIAPRAYADSIPTYNATSLNVDFSGHVTTFSVSGPSFSFNGFDFLGGYILFAFYMGEPVGDLSLDFDTFTVTPGFSTLSLGEVTIGGVDRPAVFEGGGSESAYSNLPPELLGPVPSIATGSFQACIFKVNPMECYDDFVPINAIFSVNLAGTLDINLFSSGDGFYLAQTATFTGSQTPEPSNLVLVAIGFGMLALLPILPFHLFQPVRPLQHLTRLTPVRRSDDAVPLHHV